MIDIIKENCYSISSKDCYKKPCWQKIKKTACKCKTISIIKVQCDRFKIHKLCSST